ncbi:MAG: lytic transglycosylase, partial [Bradyrhizobium sp.]|nr:lytic transglycosylase [Bradyrhizobium sp.]
MRTFIGLPAALCAVVLALAQPAARAMAEEAAPAAAGVEPAKPGVEEPAGSAESGGRAEKPANSARETDTREAMCLMIESAA